MAFGSREYITGRTHRLYCHNMAVASIFTPDVAKSEEAGVSDMGSMFCINCCGDLSEANAAEPPYLCNSCKPYWKEPRYFSSLPAIITERERKNIIVIVLNPYNIVGVYDADYNRVPAHLGFLWGKKVNGELKFFQPKAVWRALRKLKGK